MRTITINDKDYSKNLINGYTTKETLTEELDSANIILTCVQKTNFDPFDKVVINENGHVYSFIVDTYVESKISSNPPLYEYNLQLISETKVLERIILPNLKITKPKYNSEIKKMGNYLDFILTHYARQKYYLEMSSSLKAELNNHICPEWAWASPTLKQVFNDLLQTLDNPKLVKVNNGVVGAIELSKKNKQINLSIGKVTDDNYQSIKEYVNNLVVDTKNILPNGTNVMTAPNVSFRSNDKAYITTEDLELYLANARIEKIDKLLVTTTLKYTSYIGETNLTRTIDLDITNWLEEETFYNQLMPEQRNVRLYYKRGGDSIKGFAFKHNELLPEAITNVLNAAIFVLNSEATGVGVYSGYDGDVRQLKFTCFYQNIGESRVKIYRDELKKYDLSLVDNQSSAFIDALKFLQAEREKINRLGNDIRTITWVIKDYDNIPQLNDYIDDYYLANKEVAHYGEFYIVKATLSKDYIQKNLYYGLQSRTRFTNFEMANNSVLRVENISKMIYLSTTNKTISGTSNKRLCSYIARNYANPNSSSINVESKGIKQIIATSTFANGETAQYYLQPSIYSLDHSTIVSVRYYDNINVGMKLDLINVFLGYKYGQSYVPYVDSNGEVKSLKFDLYSRYSFKYRGANKNEETFDEMLNYPDIIDGYVDEQYLEYTLLDTIYKDNAETLQYDLQFNFVAEKNIVLGNKLGLFNPIADLTAEATDHTRETKSKLLNLKIYYSTTERYDRYEFYAKGEMATNITFRKDTYENWTNGILKNEIRLGIPKTSTFDDVDTSTWQSWCLATEDGELIFGVNRDLETNTISDIIYVTTD